MSVEEGMSDEIDRLRAEDKSLYCPTCGACGEAGCCPPDQCKHLKCYYGEHYIKTYRELEAENDLLVALNDSFPLEIVKLEDEIADLKESLEDWKKAWRLESAAREQAEKEIAELKNGEEKQFARRLESIAREELEIAELKAEKDAEIADLKAEIAVMLGH